MIEVRELVKKYGNKTVLDHVSFDVKDGEVHNNEYYNGKFGGYRWDSSNRWT